MVNLDIKGLFEDVKREQKFSNMKDTVSDVLHKADTNVTEPKKAAVKAQDEKIETTIDNTVDNNIEEISQALALPIAQSEVVITKPVKQPKVVVFDYASFVLDVDLDFSNKDVSESMLTHFSKRFEPIMVTLSIEILNEFRKGVPSVYYEKLQKAIQEYLSGTSITIQGATYHISSQNWVFSKQETFQKFLFFLFLDRMMLDHAVTMLFSQITPQETSIHREANQLYGTSMVRTIATQAAVQKYKLNLFSKDTDENQVLQRFHDEDDDNWDVFMALVAYYSKADVSGGRKVIGFHEDVSTIEWKDVSFELPPQMLVAIESQMNVLNEKIDVQQKQLSQKKDFTDMYEKMNEQIQLSNRLNEQFQVGFNKQQELQDALLEKQNQMIEQSNTSTKNQKMILEVLSKSTEKEETSVEKEILSEMRALREEMNQANTSSFEIDFEKVFERLLANQMSNFGDVVANKVGTVFKNQSDEKLDTLKGEVVGVRNLLKNFKQLYEDSLQAQNEQWRFLSETLKKMDIGDMKNHLVVLRNELLQRLDALAGNLYQVQLNNQGQSYVVANASLGQLYQMVAQLSQQMSQSQASNNIETVLNGFEQLNQSIQSLQKEVAFGPEFLTSLSKALGIEQFEEKRQADYQNMQQMMAQLVVKDDFVQLRDELTQMFKTMQGDNANETLVQDIVQGHILAILGDLTNQTVSLKEVKGLQMAMEIGEYRKELF